MIEQICTSLITFGEVTIALLVLASMIYLSIKLILYIARILSKKHRKKVYIERQRERRKKIKKEIELAYDMERTARICRLEIECEELRARPVNMQTITFKGVYVKPKREERREIVL